MEDQTMTAQKMDFVPYGVLGANCLLFTALRYLSRRLAPAKCQLFFSELFSSLELCVDCAELGVVLERHGTSAYGIGLILCCLWWFSNFGEADACPSPVLEDWLFLGTPLTSQRSLTKLIAQFLAAFFTTNYLNCIWCLHLTEEHKLHHLERCESSLQVPIAYGAVIEGVITFISRYVYLHSEHWQSDVANYTNSVLTALLCLAAMDSSGGYFNPLLASALTFNCKGNSAFEHFIVYWLGSLIGSFMARWFFILKQRAAQLKID